MFCAGAHQSALQAAGCLPPQIAAFCSANNQCTLPYKNVTDAWRNISHLAKGPGGWMGDVKLGYRECGTDIEPTQATGVGGGGWYRFGGSGGDALPLTPQGIHHCGTDRTGWLSGWDAGGGVAAPPGSYGSAGRYPAAAEGVAEMTACFDNSNTGNTGAQCLYHAAVGVVRCEGFLLWRLQSLQPSCTSFCGGCTLGYCTAPSGL